VVEQRFRINQIFKTENITTKNRQKAMKNGEIGENDDNIEIRNESESKSGIGF